MCDQSTNTDANQTIYRLDSMLKICIDNIIQNNATNELLLIKIQHLTDRIESLEIINQIDRIDKKQSIENQTEKKFSKLNDNNHPIVVNIKRDDCIEMMPSTSKIRENINTNENNETPDTISKVNQDLIECGVFLLDGKGYRVKLDKNIVFITSMYLTIKSAKESEEKVNAEKEEAMNAKVETKELKAKATKVKKSKAKAEKLNKENLFKEYYAPYKWYIIDNTTEEKKMVLMKSEYDTLKTVIEYNKIVDFPLRLLMGCRPTLFVWRVSLTERWGHISLLLSDGSYISFWPEAKQKSTWRTLEDDIAEEGIAPHEMHSLDFFTLFQMDENAIKQWWPGFLKTDRYNPVTNNCAHVVLKALIVGDVWMSEPLKIRLFGTPVRSPVSVGEQIEFIIEQTINNPKYRNKKFVPHVAKSGSGKVDVMDERLEDYNKMQNKTQYLFKHFTNTENQ